ncbi:MAG: endonuclease III [Dehalococcoidia bacterium]
MAAPPGLAEWVAFVSEHLVERYGRRRFRLGDPLNELIGTILSQNTSDLNSSRAFAALKNRYPQPGDLLAAPPEELAATIRSGGLANIKAERIQQALHAIVERTGALDLGVLADLPMPKARAWLAGLPGVGGKTASCVLLFALGMPAMPVDTHVQRLSVRLGFAPVRSSPDTIAAILETATNPAAIYDLHVNLIQHGRTICIAGRPRCRDCLLEARCPKVGVARQGEER